MPYNSIINRNNAEALIPQQVANEIIQELPRSSYFMALANRMPDMTAKQMKIPVMTGNASAYFVSGDNGLKQTTNMTWDKVYITAEEIAAIVTVPEAVLDDAEYDIWAQVKPRLVEAFAKVIDQAAFFGTNKPDSWPAGLVPGANTAGNYKVVGTNGLYSALLGEDGVVAKVEEQGLPVTSYIGALPFRAKYRNALDSNGQPMFHSYAQSNGAGNTYELDGVKIEFPDNGAWDATSALLLAGDFRLARYAVRQDITFKIFDQGIIQNASGEIETNLMQQDCVALRAVMRMGWALPKPVNPVSGVNYYPFSILKPTTVTPIESAAYNVTTPAKSGTPQATHDSGTGYTAAITWSPADATFKASTVYTATVVLTAASGYVFADDFSAADVTGLPATTGSGAVAQTVTVTHDSDTQVTIAVKYVATGA